MAAVQSGAQMQGMPAPTQHRQCTSVASNISHCHHRMNGLVQKNLLHSSGLVLKHAGCSSADNRPCQSTRVNSFQAANKLRVMGPKRSHQFSTVPHLLRSKALSCCSPAPQRSSTPHVCWSIPFQWLAQSHLTCPCSAPAPAHRAPALQPPPACSPSGRGSSRGARCNLQGRHRGWGRGDGWWEGGVQAKGVAEKNGMDGQSDCD